MTADIFGTPICPNGDDESITRLTGNALVRRFASGVARSFLRLGKEGD
jgi:hypothetical protein